MPAIICKKHGTSGVVTCCEHAWKRFDEGDGISDFRSAVVGDSDRDPLRFSIFLCPACVAKSGLGANGERVSLDEMEHRYPEIDQPSFICAKCYREGGEKEEPTIRCGEPGHRVAGAVVRPRGPGC
jgi:DNA-directed RNA polymerase subunit RPC12/RpoP